MYNVCMASKRPFLVCDDYGMGGVWAYLWAESHERIAQEFPSLVIADSLPAWLVQCESRSTLPTFDIDEPGEWLESLRAAEERA
jgi:hypothetical protein